MIKNTEIDLKNLKVLKIFMRRFLLYKRIILKMISPLCSFANSSHIEINSK